MLSVKEEMAIKKYFPSNKELRAMTNIFSIFSDNTRLKILILLTIKPFCVGDITEILNINQTTLSHQLKLMRSAGFVDFERSGKNVYYYLKNNDVEKLFDTVVDIV